MKPTTTRWRRWLAAAILGAAAALALGGGAPVQAPAELAAARRGFTAPQARPAAERTVPRAMPAVAERAARFVAEQRLDAEVVAGLREVAVWQRELAADTGPAPAEERSARRARRAEFRALLRDVLARMEPGQRAAMRRARLTVIQVARTIDRT